MEKFSVLVGRWCRRYECSYAYGDQYPMKELSLFSNKPILGFSAVTATAFISMAASGTPSPLYVAYQEAGGLSVVLSRF